MGIKTNVALLLLDMLPLTWCLCAMHVVKPRTEVQNRKEYAFLPYIFA